MSHSLRRSDSGTSVIEFAVLAPVIIFLLMGLIEVGRFMYFGLLASHAARAGVQYAARNLSTASDASVNGPATRNAAIADAQSLSAWNVTSSITCTLNGQATTCPSNTANFVPPGLVYYVEVKVNGTFNSLMKYPGLPQQIPVSSFAIMPVNNQ